MSARVCFIAAVVAALAGGHVSAVTNLGTGTAALLDNDLTDPEQNGNDSGPEDADGNGLFNATFFANSEPTFSNSTGGGPSEAAFDVFDNKLGGGEAKWCCSTPTASGLFVGADFRGKLLGTGDYIRLTHFTIGSDNDVGISRDPDVWFIEGSNDGSNWDIIFSYIKDGNSPFDDFGGSADQRVLRYDVGTDFAPPGLYQLLRFRVTNAIGGTAGSPGGPGINGAFALGEIEFFGNIVHIPEPATLSLLALAGMGMLRRRRPA